MVMLSYKLYIERGSSGNKHEGISLHPLIYGTDQKRRQDSERVRTVTTGPRTFLTLSSELLPGWYGAKKKPAVSTR